eukprot:m.42531 g.42531  ORF g.42531 m.42531 type:complete len:408 (-) comp10523_c1_seq6:930-2153(-)
MSGKEGKGGKRAAGVRRSHTTSELGNSRQGSVKKGRVLSSSVVELDVDYSIDNNDHRPSTLTTTRPSSSSNYVTTSIPSTPHQRMQSERTSAKSMRSQVTSYAQSRLASSRATSPRGKKKTVSRSETNPYIHATDADITIQGIVSVPRPRVLSNDGKPSNANEMEISDVVEEEEEGDNEKGEDDDDRDEDGFILNNPFCLPEFEGLPEFEAPPQLSHDDILRKYGILEKGSDSEAKEVNKEHGNDDNPYEDLQPSEASGDIFENSDEEDENSNEFDGTVATKKNSHLPQPPPSTADKTNSFYARKHGTLQTENVPLDGEDESDDGDEMDNNDMTTTLKGSNDRLTLASSSFRLGTKPAVLPKTPIKQTYPLRSTKSSEQKRCESSCVYAYLCVYVCMRKNVCGNVCV